MFGIAYPLMAVFCSAMLYGIGKYPIKAAFLRGLTMSYAAINLATMHADSALPKLGAAVFFVAPFSVAISFAWTQGLLVVRGAWISGLKALGRKARDDRHDGPAVPSVAGRMSMPTPEVLQGDAEIGLIELPSLQRR